jgi:hypothetical protein
MAITKLVSDSLGAGVGGSLVKLSSASASSDASVSFDLSSTYDNYLLIGHKVRPVTDNVEPYMYFSEDGGSSYKTSDTYSGRTYARITDSAVSGGEQNTIAGAVQIATDLGNDGNGSFEFWFFGANDTGGSGTANKFGNCTYTAKHKDFDYTWDTGFAVTGDVAINQLKFQMSSGNILTGEFTLYGMAK